MKKTFLISIVLMLWGGVAQVFGMYGWSSLWIGFPTDPNQLRIRTDQVGFVLGNGTIKGTFGFKANRGILGYGDIFAINSTSTASQHNSESSYLNSTISAGLAYTSDAISVGVGYNFTYFDRFIQVHTPVLVLKVSDKFRTAIPIRVASGKRYTGTVETNLNLVSPQSAQNTNDYLGVSIHPQFRIYPGMDLLRQIRLYIDYGMNKISSAQDKNNSIMRQNFSFQLRIYQDYYVENVRIQPYLRIMFATAFNNVYGSSFDTQGATKYGKSGGYAGLSASSGWDTVEPSMWLNKDTIHARNPWYFNIAIPLGIFANSDILSFYFMPELGLSITGAADYKWKERYALSYGIYAEIYMTPIKNVEWYNELGMNGDSTAAGITGIKWEVSSGITWYLPTFND